MTKILTSTKTLTLNVPADGRAVTVHLQVEAECTCAASPSQRPGSYTDSQPPKRKVALANVSA